MALLKSLHPICEDREILFGINYLTSLWELTFDYARLGVPAACLPRFRTEHILHTVGIRGFTHPCEPRHILMFPRMPFIKTSRALILKRPPISPNERDKSSNEAAARWKPVITGLAAGYSSARTKSESRQEEKGFLLLSTWQPAQIITDMQTGILTFSWRS